MNMDNKLKIKHYFLCKLSICLEQALLTGGVSLDKRVLDIVGLLKNSNKPLSMAFLCSQFDVSARTVRYSLNTIDELLLKLNHAPLIRNRTGIYLDLNQNEKDIFCRYIKIFLLTRFLLRLRFFSELLHW